MSFFACELLIANINWYCRLLRLYGQGTAVDVILAVGLCLPFIRTFSRLSFPSFVCFLFTPPVVLCHNKVSYIPSSDSFLIPLSLWSILLFVFPLHHPPPPPMRAWTVQRRDKEPAIQLRVMWARACTRVFCFFFFGPRGLFPKACQERCELTVWRQPRISADAKLRVLRLVQAAICLL